MPEEKLGEREARRAPLLGHSLRLHSVTLSRPLPVSVCPARSLGLQECLSCPLLPYPGARVSLTHTGTQDTDASGGPARCGHVAVGFSHILSAAL